MPFSQAMQLMDAYCKNRRKDLMGGKRLRPFTETAGAGSALTGSKDLADFIAAFDAKDEDQRWFQDFVAEEPALDVSEAVGLRIKLGWLCGCRRDLRIQFCAGEEDRRRVSLDHVRFACAEAEWARKNLVRLKQLVTEHRVKLA